MTNPILTSAAALALLAAPAFAQEATTGDQAAAPAADQQMPADQQMAAGDPQMMRDSAIQSAESVGITQVGDVAGAMVLQGTSPTGLPILMVVGPAGELLALATPLAGAVTGVEPTAAGTTGAEPQAGEPAQEGFMATQTQPASPQAWDPAMVEGAMRSLGGEAATTGETPEQ